jgi:ABC-type phosphate transport system substrate-binding protein
MSIAATASLLATSVVAAAAPAVATAAVTCVVEHGSTTVYPALTQAQPGFSGNVTNPQPAWPTGQNLGCNTSTLANGSGAGKADLMAYYVSGGSTVVDLAASSSPLSGSTTPSETTNLLAFQVGGDAMVLAVKSDSPVTGITMAEVAGIYNGNITTWQQLSGANGKTGTIVPRSRIIGSGTRDDMNRLFKMDRGAGNTGPACSSGFTTCEPTVVAGTGLSRLTTSQDEADAACNNSDQIVYTSLANLAAFGPGGSGCLKALPLQSCSFTGYPATTWDNLTCSGAFVAPSVVSAASSGTYPAKRVLFLVLPKIAVAAAKFGTGNGTGWTDQLGLTKAEDIVNYMESTQGQTAMGAVGFVQISVPSKQPIPDADIDLNGGIGLTDIGQITGRWNRVDTIPGSVRADVDNNGGVGLTDIGKITGQWGATGFVAP